MCIRDSPESFGVIALEGDRNNTICVIPDSVLLIFQTYVLTRGLFTYKYYVQIYSF